jgi:small subunit ribosomal protein S11
MGSNNNTVSKAKNNKTSRLVTVGVVYVNASFNNTSITISDSSGAVLAWHSAGADFKGSKKSTPYAARVVAESVSDKVEKYGLKTVSIRLKGPGGGRESAVITLANKFNVTSITETTPTPHNGCRPPKRRRI